MAPEKGVDNWIVIVCVIAAVLVIGSIFFINQKKVIGFFVYKKKYKKSRELGDNFKGEAL
jgi:hypothetical protein